MYDAATTFLFEEEEALGPLAGRDGGFVEGEPEWTLFVVDGDVAAIAGVFTGDTAADVAATATGCDNQSGTLTEYRFISQTILYNVISNDTLYNLYY